MLFIAMNGAENTFLAQSLNANNLANVSTTAFKADLAQFRSMEVIGESTPSRVFALTERPSTDFTAGALIQTDNDFDVAIEGNGFFTVSNQEGQEAYSRDGALKINADGILVNSRDLPILGDGGEISIPPAQKIEIGSDGSISIVPMESAPNTLVFLDRLRLVQPEIDNITKGADGLFYPKEGGFFETDDTVKIVKGFLEGSNVNAVESITTMISLARQYEIQLKMIEQAKANDEAATSLLRMS